jgi:hypothetical protein
MFEGVIVFPNLPDGFEFSYIYDDGGACTVAKRHDPNLSPTEMKKDVSNTLSDLLSWAKELPVELI